MVRRQLAGRDITSARVLAAMGEVPRHRFVPEALRGRAYDDGPLPIGHDQTINQPYIVALMTQLAELAPGDRVLEVGTGSGYQAAVLVALGAEVYSIEIVEPLGRRAAATLEALSYEVHLRIGDGYAGWPERAPFDAILLTAAPASIPEPLRGASMLPAWLFKQAAHTTTLIARPSLAIAASVRARRPPRCARANMPS